MVGRICLVTLLALAGASGAGPSSVQPPTPGSTGGRRALILFDGTALKHREGTIDAVHIANLLGHFGFTGTRVPIEQYRDGDLTRYDATFVVMGNEASEAVPQALVRDTRATTRPLILIGYQLDRFAPPAETSRWGFSVGGYLRNTTFDRVRYHGATLGKGSHDVAQIAVSEPARAVVRATAVAPDGREIPYIVQSGRVWVVGDVPFAYVDEQDRYLVFCDALHDMLDVAHQTEHRALIRIEDVNPQDDPANVRRTIGAFVSEGVPFQIALVPIFRNPATGEEVTLSDRPALVAVLAEAVAHGGTIVLHGATHQYRGVTPDDLEFWDSERNAPRPDDTVEMVRDKLLTALEECFRNGLFPVAWETPHYAASQLDYREIGRVFSTIYERPLAVDIQGTQQFFPFPTTDLRGLLVVPENLGYLPAAKPDPALVLANARASLIVRDGMASGYVHDFLDPAPFHEIVRGVQALGYRYVSIRDFPSRVTAGNRLVLTHGATGSLTVQDAYLHQILIGSDGAHLIDRYSSAKMTGTITPTLAPDAGQILVARGVTTLPSAAPGPATRGWQIAEGLWSRVQRHTPVPARVPKALSVALAWDAGLTGEAANDQASFRAAFSAYGVRPREVARGMLASADLDAVLVVPAPSARLLSKAEVAAIVRRVREGRGLVTDGRSPLAEALGIVYTGRRASVGSITDRAEPAAALRWRPLVAVDGFRPPAGSVTLAQDSGTDTAVAVSFATGTGQVLYLAAPLDPYTPDATSRYPFLFEHVLDTFARAMPARRSGIELYFDPGLRQGVNIETLAPMWRRLGVRVVYAAAWEFDANYTYDYERLVRVCHENGLLVYAWFEFPQVSRLFWARHPEWREVPAAGTAYPSWRLAMNLANPQCLSAAIQFMTDVVARWGWDGVNLAELNFDGVADGDRPEQSVPMNADVRAAFEARSGFDPSDLFDPDTVHWWKKDRRGWSAWIDYRQSLVTAWHRDFLAALKALPESGREVIVTMLDSLEHPAIATNAGVRSDEILALWHDFDFTLQVEDPAVAWTGPPSRYERLAARYRALVPPGHRFMFDINVVPDRLVETTHLPVSRAAGIELAATVRAARTASSRVAMYGDATIRPRDLELIAAAFATSATVTAGPLQWTVDAADAVDIVVPASVHDYYVDGVEWPYGRPGLVTVPPGHHVVTAYRPWFRLLDLSALRPQVLTVNAALQSAEAARGHVRFEYASDTRALVLVDRRPEEAVLDDRTSVEMVETASRTIVLTLPPGRHAVDISGSSAAGMVLDVTSIISSSLIVAFGTTACALLVAAYIAIRVRRLFRRKAP